MAEDQERFQAGVFLDGSVNLRGVFLGTDGWVRLTPEQARQLQDLLNRSAPPALSRVEQKPLWGGIVGGGVACAQGVIKPLDSGY